MWLVLVLHSLWEVRVEPIIHFDSFFLAFDERTCNMFTKKKQNVYILCWYMTIKIWTFWGEMLIPLVRIVSCWVDPRAVVHLWLEPNDARTVLLKLSPIKNYFRSKNLNSNRFRLPWNVSVIYWIMFTW